MLHKIAAIIPAEKLRNFESYYDNCRKITTLPELGEASYEWNTSTTSKLEGQNIFQQFLQFCNG